MPIYIYKNNQQYGPYDESTVAEWLKNGQCLPNDLAYREGMTEWQPLWTLINISTGNSMGQQHWNSSANHDYPPMSPPQMINQDSQRYAEYLPPGPSPIVHRPYSPVSAPPYGMPQSREAKSATGLAQMFGLDIRAAVLMVIIDLMVFVGDTITWEALLPLGIAIGGVLTFIVYKIQRHWYGDDKDSALIKALIAGLLTAIPVPLTPIIAIPGGIFGLIKRVSRK